MHLHAIITYSSCGDLFVISFSPFLIDFQNKCGPLDKGLVHLLLCSIKASLIKVYYTEWPLDRTIENILQNNNN